MTDLTKEEFEVIKYQLGGHFEEIISTRDLEIMEKFEKSIPQILENQEIRKKLEVIRNHFVNDRPNVPLYALCDYLLGNRDDLIVYDDNRDQEMRKID